MTTQGDHFVIDRNTGAPATSLRVKMNALVRRAMREVAAIRMVLSFGCIAQIVPSVIRAVAVSMVNLTLRPLSCHVNEGDNGRRIFDPIYSQTPSAVAGWRAAPIATAVTSNLPSKPSGSRVVMEQFADAASYWAHLLFLDGRQRRPIIANHPGDFHVG